jgi:hypothetical protein
MMQIVDQRRLPSVEKVLFRVVMWSIGFDALGRALWAPKSYVSRLLEGDPFLREVFLIMMCVALVIFALDILVNDILPQSVSWDGGVMVRPLTLSLMGLSFMTPMLATQKVGDLSSFELWSFALHGSFYAAAAIVAVRAINRRKGLAA